MKKETARESKYICAKECDPKQQKRGRKLCQAFPDIKTDRLRPGSQVSEECLKILKACCAPLRETCRPQRSKRSPTAARQ